MKEYYSRLFLKDGVSVDEVKKAYRKLVKKFHPDKNKESNEYTPEFKLIQEAYEKLIGHLEPTKEKQKEHSNKHYDSTMKSKEGIVRSDAKFAEAGDDFTNNSLYKIVMTILISLLIICSITAAINQSHLFMKAILFALGIPYILGFIYSLSKQFQEAT